MTRMMTPLRVNPRDLLIFLDALSKRTKQAMVWVKGHDGPFSIEVPEHLSHTVGPRDSRCSRVRESAGDDDQAIVEVLWLVQEAMEAEKPARRATRKKTKTGRR